MCFSKDYRKQTPSGLSDGFLDVLWSLKLFVIQPCHPSVSLSQVKRSKVNRFKRSTVILSILSIAWPDTGSTPTTHKQQTNHRQTKHKPYYCSLWVSRAVVHVPQLVRMWL